MGTVVVPYHLDQRLAGFDVGLRADLELTVDLPIGDPWQRMAVLYEQVADAVSRHRAPPLVVAGDCTTSLGVLAGLQRAGHDVGIVWFDARDTDPGEHDLLERSSVARTTVAHLTEHDLPDGELYLHIDVDVCDPSDVPACGTRPPAARRSSRCSPRFSGSAPPAGSPPSGLPLPGTRTAPAGPFTSSSYGASTRPSSTDPIRPPPQAGP